MKRAILFLLWTVAGCFGQIQNPNHLAPIEPYDPYNEMVFHSLVVSGPNWHPSLWMICQPGLSREYAVIIYCRDENPKATPFDREVKLLWFLEIATAERQIWHVRIVPDKRHSTKSGTSGGVPVIEPRRNVKVERKRIPIDEQAVDQLTGAWLAVLRKTRYSDEHPGEVGITDGESYQFCASGKSGGTYTPETGLPAALVKLAEKMGKLAQSAADDRPALLTETLNDAQLLKQQADTDPANDHQPSGSPSPAATGNPK